jgi:site-specific recombinase XerD
MVSRAKNTRWQELDKGNIPLERLAQHFEAFNRSEGKSLRTVEWYCKDIAYLIKYLKQEGRSTLLADVNILVVRDFILYLQNKTRWTGHPNMSSPRGRLAASTIQNYVRGLRAFFNWLYKEGYTEEHILGDLRPPRAPQKLVAILTESEIRVILSCLQTDTASGCRDAAIIITALDTGLRLSEITSVKIADAQIQEGYLKVMGKGAKERIVPVGGLAQKALQRYVFHFRPEPIRNDDNNLFLTLDGYPMSNEAVRLILKRISKKSGVSRLHPHLCRHTFATNYLINGGDVFSLQQILGHTSLEMVRRYVTLASAQVRVQHRKFSPMDRMNLGRVRLGRSVKMQSRI